MTNDEKVAGFRLRRSGFTFDAVAGRRRAIPWTFVIRASSFRARGAFTLIELIVVIAIIIILAGLILSTVGYVQKKGALSRAETEIAAMSAACESYKADNGIYPRGQSTSAPPTGIPLYTVDAQTANDPSDYQSATLFLYKQLSGDTGANFQPPAGAKSYFAFKPQMLDGTRDTNGNLTSVSYIRDPFGNSYGYSTAYQADLEAGVSPPRGYNPTFDLWSTASDTTGNRLQWVKNW
jgi:type II secretory pathway pseudopilin PulG